MTRLDRILAYFALSPVAGASKPSAVTMISVIVVAVGCGYGVQELTAAPRAISVIVMVIVVVGGLTYAMNRRPGPG